ncbi:ABC transporter ATP-binding protein [Sulfobacillus thermosulfidooxidans]|uniref:ABC transporter ATP-binding protein n=1 Tax=Sulfobacillus thermosulfidooxidans TaxID=28034 RepID=UPI00096B8283|nr:ABC transporter ATP-binding protein [Sulfobacillus thermosulfidooxidans]OLZ11379.1 dipeptide/oligopeptide/nickel ABC transporter ATP-binding protein [Sulfobacillus thermosulfidooxidans]OLZ14023.1 dipeptide/oligopeptide/nickel ABC transporter ATP-binding protein [Sulfobacillus thermosulfidooxidans]OLZ19885.1 dipeptide/oligopeptide/nickel ABC transporter ATP-binding protein [Sulfobacillus thermosulfidooxidans]
MSRDPVLALDSVSIAYDSDDSQVLVVKNVSFSVFPGEVLGLVGESGSGKSTLAYGIMRLLKNASLVSGTVTIGGKDIYAMKPSFLRQFRWSQVAMAFQTAMNALNPVMTIGEQMIDTLQSHLVITREAARLRSQELLKLVRLSPEVFFRYPHELSGGMRQRVVIAIAIALEPQLVIMDEPTTGLDVVVQRSIIDQIMEIQKLKKFAILFISHDFQLVADIADRVAVMYAGRIVEITSGESLDNPLKPHHPYTRGLIRAQPRLDAEQATAIGIPGQPPDPKNLPQGCAFWPRCEQRQAICRQFVPDLLPVNDLLVACHFMREEGANVRQFENQ